MKKYKQPEMNLDQYCELVKTQIELFATDYRKTQTLCPEFVADSQTLEDWENQFLGWLQYVIYLKIKVEGEADAKAVTPV